MNRVNRLIVSALLAGGAFAAPAYAQMQPDDQPYDQPVQPDQQVPEAGTTETQRNDTDAAAMTDEQMSEAAKSKYDQDRTMPKTGEPLPNPEGAASSPPPSQR